MSLILLRHGEAQMPPNCCIGQWDVPLTDSGREQIQWLANHWSLAVPEEIVCSDLQRTHDTARTIARALEIPCQTDRRLREIDFGRWENRSWDDIHQQDSQLMAQWGENWLDICPPGGENGRQLYARVGQCLSELGRDTLVVAHAGSLRALRCHLQGSPPEHLFDYSFERGVPLVVD